MFKRYKRYKNRKPVLSMVLGYVMFWLVLCVFLTIFIGRKKYERGVADLKQQLIWNYESILSPLKTEMLSTEDSLEEKEAEINKYMQEMITYVAGLTNEDVHTYGEYGIYDINVLKKDLIRSGDYLTVRSGEDFVNDIILSENIIPVTSEGLTGFVSERYNEKIAKYFEESYYYWLTDPTYQHSFAMYDDINLYFLETLPFSYMKGDVFFSYHTVIECADDQELNIMLFFVIPDGLRETRQGFFGAMLWIYLGSALFFAFLSWYGYRKMYSLSGKNNFHKALVSSMAHDLKEPLSNLQKKSSELKDNVETDKREHYSQELLDEIRVINDLINKNLNLSQNDSYNLDEEEKIYFSDLLNGIKEKYQELIAQKTLLLNLTGDTYLNGNPEVLELMADDIFNNTFKNASAETKVTVICKNRSFTIISRPKKTDNEPDYPVAYGIIQERGWYMKKNYDRKKERFIIKVVLRKWR